MRGINKVIIVGTITQDIDLKYSANGNPIANLNVATNEEWTDKSNGKKQQKSEYHRVSIFGKLAEVAGQYLTKGSQVYLEGKLQTRKWQDQSGQDRYTTEVVLSGFDGKMEMLGGGQSSGQNQAQSQSQQSGISQQTQQQPQQQYQSSAQMQQQPKFSPNDFANDNVPF